MLHFTATALAQTIVSGLMVGLIYALVAIGLTLIFGVMEIVNFAHGEFLMLGMYASFWGAALLFLDPLFSLPLTALMLFAFGATIYRFVIKRILSAPMLSQIFVTFGLMIMLRGVAQFLWRPDHRTVPHPLVEGRVSLMGLHFGTPEIAAGLGAIVVTGALWWFLNKTRIGVALEATSIDREAATLMGINTERMFALAWGLGAACAGVAGALLSTYFPIFPEVGADFSLIAFVVVVLGGFGSVAGAFWAGIIVGEVEVLGGFFIGPAYKTALVLSLFILVLLVRPRGLLGKA